MTGTLGLFSLVDLFQLIATSARTGRLAVFHPEGQARIYFSEGQVVHAEFAGVVGEEAVLGLFADERGSFDFQMSLPAPSRTVSTSTENLLLEVIRRLDESRRDGGSSVSEDAVPSLIDNGADVSKLTLQASEMMVLERIDAQHSVADIARLARLSVSDVQRVTERLLKVGVIKLRSRKPRTARLVVQLTPRGLAAGTVGVEANIYANWERTLGYAPTQVACRRPDGRVDIYKVVALESVGPYLLMARETLFKADLGVNSTLLVRPAPRARVGS